MIKILVGSQDFFILKLCKAGLSILKRKDFRHSDGLLLPRVAAVWLCLRGEACRHITEVRRAWETEL